MAEHTIRFDNHFIASSWPEFTGLLLRLHLSIREIPGIPSLQFSVGAHPFVRTEHLRQIEDSHLEAIERVVEELCERGIASCGTAEIAFVALRAETAAWFVQRFSVSLPVGEATILPFPELPVLHVARWFLIPWWTVHGRASACGARVLDTMHDLFGPSPPTI